MTNTDFPTAKKSLEQISNLIQSSLNAGADSADAIVGGSTSISASSRLEKLEDFERSEDWELGLRVFIGTRQAIVSSSDPSENAMSELVERAINMARAVPKDPYVGLADTCQLTEIAPDLGECDPCEPSIDDLIDLAQKTESAALSISGVTNSEGAAASWGKSWVALAASNGFARIRNASRHSLSVSVIAGKGTEMERDYDMVSAVWKEDMPDPHKIGLLTGERAVKRLGPKKIKSAQTSVVYDPRVANTLLHHFSGAINGASVSRGTTFLKDSLGKAVFAKGIDIIDDPLRKRGLRSKAFDAEGLPTKKHKLIDDGLLTTWILSLASGRQLQFNSTGHAGRSPSSPPAPGASNLFMSPGSLSCSELISDIKDGIYVTELIGMGVNNITGDYSRGASGFWIENGEISYPVNEVTIAGNLKEMFLNLTPASDLNFRYGFNAPTVRVEGMTIAGK